MAEPRTRERPPQLNARARRAVAQLAAARKYQRGEAPSEPVNAALQSFGGTPPSPEQISTVAMQLAQKFGPAAAIEFETYVRSALIDKAAPKARTAAAENQAPPAEVQTALNSFQEMPSEEQIAAKTAELAQRSPELAASFRAYAEQLRSDRLAAEEANYSPEHQGILKEQASRQPARELQPVVPLARYRAPDARPATVAPAPRQGQSVPPPTPAPAASTEKPSAFQEKLNDAKEILQGFASVLTLGHVPAPESIKRGNDELLRRVGLEKKEEPIGRADEDPAVR